MPIEEIIVTAPRPTHSGGPATGFVAAGFGGGGGGVRLLALREGSKFGQARLDQEPIEEIVVTAKKKDKPTGILAAAAAMTRSQMLGIGRQLRTATETLPRLIGEDIFSRAPPSKYPLVAYDPKTAAKAIPEIIVKGKRLRTATAFASRFAFPVTVAEAGGRLASAIARELQRQAFDELGRYITQPSLPGPDTPLRTIRQVETETATQAETFPEPQLEEIVVTARRPRSLPFAEPLGNLFDSQWFNQEMTRNMQADAAAAAATRTRLRTPTIPQVRTRTRTQTIPQIETASQTSVKQITLPITGTVTRRSTLLGIGTGTSLGLATGLITGTGLQTQSRLQQVTRVGQRTRYCKPCPRKKKKKKARTKCYKKLIEEKRNPDKDKIFKWNEIDCTTGREIT